MKQIDKNHDFLQLSEQNCCKLWWREHYGISVYYMWQPIIALEARNGQNIDIMIDCHTTNLHEIVVGCTLYIIGKVFHQATHSALTQSLLRWHRSAP